MKFKVGDTVKVIQVESTHQGSRAAKLVYLGRTAKVVKAYTDEYAYPFLLDFDDNWLYNERELAHVYEGLPDELFEV